MTYVTSSFSMSAALRQTLGALQLQLAQGQKELASGRHADIGVALGAQTSRSFSLANTQTEIEAIRTTNNRASARLDSTQTALSNLLTSAQSMRATLLAAQTDGGDPSAIVSQARDGLANFTATINGGDGGEYLFSGQNAAMQPVENYFSDPPASNKLALDAAFRTAFGATQTDPSIADVTADQMQSFLSGDFQQLFQSASWKADWSHATDAALRSRISVSSTIDTSITANEPAFQQLAKAYTMVGDLGAENMSKPAYHAVLATALQTIDASIDALTRTQARAGVMQSSITTASDAMSVQSDTLTQQLNNLEGVDTTEAATRVNSLMTQIETAYTLTSRISQLTLTKYL